MQKGHQTPHELPTHEHDCDSCRFLGAIHQGDIVYDLYVCPSNETREADTYIARFGPHGNYSSWDDGLMEHLPHDHILWAAKRLA